MTASPPVVVVVTLLLLAATTASGHGPNAAASVAAAFSPRTAASSSSSSRDPRPTAAITSSVDAPAAATSRDFLTTGSAATASEPTTDRMATIERSDDKRKRKYKSRAWTASVTTLGGEWGQMYRKLARHVRRHGSAASASSAASRKGDDALVEWIRDQRRQCRERLRREEEAEQPEDDAVASELDALKSPRPTAARRERRRGKSASSADHTLNNERLAALNALDPKWHWTDAERQFESRYDALCNFVYEHGHAEVPHRYPPDPPLANWVRNLRREYREHYGRLHSGGGVDGEGRDGTGTTTTAAGIKRTRRKATTTKPPEAAATSAKTYLTPERIESLLGIGFSFVPLDSRDAQWNAKCDALQSYRDRHGHCLVPEKYDADPSLGIWVSNQRTQYRRYLAGKSSSLNRNRMERLENLGFVWSSVEHKWCAMLERLKRYRDATGGSWTVPVTDRDNQDLRLWIVRQRSEYRRRKEGLRSSMTDRRIQALEDSGFEWTARGRGGGGTAASQTEPREGGSASGIDGEESERDAGPTAEDWSKLFDKMREGGLEAGMKPKAHWFEGQSPFDDLDEDHTDGDDDLMSLWNQEDDFDDEDDW